MINLALIQHSFKGSKQATIDFTLKKIAESAESGANLVALQELHTSEYFCQREDVEFFAYAESFEREKKIFANAAKKHKIVLVTSLFEARAKGLYHNTAVVFEKDGSIAGQYRKMHIPDDPSFYEKFYFTPGDNDFKPIQTSLGKIGVLICWDQWFPEAARLMVLSGAEIIIYPTAIGWDLNDSQDEKQRQLEAWKAVQRGHAVANGVFVCAVNRWGIETCGGGNSPLGLHSADLANFGEQQTQSLVVSPKFAKSHESQTENPSVVDSAHNAQNLEENSAKIAESALDSAESQNLNKNNSVRSTQTRPLRGAKNRDKASSSASADFLLEAEKRGTLPKSEKRQLLARRGSEVGGAALLRKESSEISGNGGKVAESTRDSSVASLPQNDKIMDCHADSTNLLVTTKNNDSAESAIDSTESRNLQQKEQPTNSSISDEKSGLRSHEREDRTDEFIDEASGKSPRFIAERRIWADSAICFWGNSFVFGPQGEPLALASENKDEILRVTIDLRRISQVRNIWPFLRDRRIEFYGDLTKRFID